jgi:hypothetical protein
MATEWNKAVKKAFKMGRKTNKNFTLKQAMFDAKKIYKKKRGSKLPKYRGKTRKTRGGGGEGSASVVPFSGAGGIATNASKL